MSLKERDRFSVLRQVREGVPSVSAGAARIGVTPRHFRRLRRRFETEGDAAVVHGLRGRRSNGALPRAFRERALKVARDPLYRDFGPTLLAEHLERSFAMRVSLDTLRNWMMEAGLWKRRRRRARHRSRRPRRVRRNPPISGPGVPVPPIGGSTTHPTPRRLAGGGKHSPKGGHFLVDKQSSRAKLLSAHGNRGILRESSEAHFPNTRST